MRIGFFISIAISVALVKLLHFDIISSAVLGLCVGIFIRRFEEDMYQKRKKSGRYIKDETPKDF